MMSKQHIEVEPLERPMAELTEAETGEVSGGTAAFMPGAATDPYAYKEPSFWETAKFLATHPGVLFD